MVETELIDRLGRREDPAEIRFSYACSHLGREGLRDALDLVEYSIRHDYKECFYKGTSSGAELETFDNEFESGSLLSRLPRLIQRADDMIATWPVSSLTTAWQMKDIIQLAAVFSPGKYSEYVNELQPREMVILVAARLEVAGYERPIERLLEWGGGVDMWIINAETDDEVRDVLARFRAVREKVGDRQEWDAVWSGDLGC
ncbi:hypothetical protein H072_2862 [Dactylellina haptotyla CBS 200.50]|uniref:Uncharacterized protein n=1 Tax=Dactylellina haptotyla (strain CBS 200.50) TaxID=1284197 RepID=S8AJJ1_DACHA|nr:hypothetical protein H072_2862 [Dactylellina haptotyla CBS 200.50]